MHRRILMHIISQLIFFNWLDIADFCRILEKLQSFSYFETLWCFTKFSFHHKWNDARLLLINMVYIQSMRTPVTLTNTLSSPTNPITPRDPANHAHPSTHATPPTPNRELNMPPNLERESEEFLFLIAIHSTQGWTATTRLKTKKKKRWKGCPLT